MERRAVSLAFYFTGLFLAVALVLTVRGAPFSFLLVRYWPVLSAFLLVLSAYSWKDPDNRFAPIWEMRTWSLLHLSLAPFFCWYCQMKAVGVGFVLTKQHIYLQLMALLYVVTFPMVMRAFGDVVQQSRELRESGISRALWRYSFYLLLAPMLAALAGSIYLALLHTPPNGNPLKLLPVALLEAGMRSPLSGLFTILLPLAILGQLLGAIRLLLSPKTADSGIEGSPEFPPKPEIHIVSHDQEDSAD